MLGDNKYFQDKNLFKENPPVQEAFAVLN